MACFCFLLTSPPMGSQLLEKQWALGDISWGFSSQPTQGQLQGWQGPHHLSSDPFLSEKAMEALTAAILDLVELYCNTFNADFQPAVHGSHKHDLVQEACHFSGPLAFTVYATHRIPITWAAR